MLPIFPKYSSRHGNVNNKYFILRFNNSVSDRESLSSYFLIPRKSNKNIFLNKGSAKVVLGPSRPNRSVLIKQKNKYLLSHFSW